MRETRSPFTGGKVKEIDDIEEIEYKGERFVVSVRYYVCEDAGEQFTTTEQDQQWYEQLEKQYKERHKLD